MRLNDHIETTGSDEAAGRMRCERHRITEERHAGSLRGNGRGPTTLVEKTCEAKPLPPRCKSLLIERRQRGNAPESLCHPISPFLRSLIRSRLTVISRRWGSPY